MKRTLRVFLLASGAASPPLWAETLPDAAQMAAAGHKAAALLAAPELQAGKLEAAGRMIHGLPAPAPAGKVLDKLFAQVQQPLQPATAGTPTLMVLVSLAMPKAALQHLAQQADRAGAVLVLRGLVEDSFGKTTQAIRDILGDTAGDSTFQVNPTVFRRYQVQDVPTFILAKAPANAEDTCVLGDDYVAVRGDATLAYALRKLGEHQGWETASHPYLQALGEKP